MQSIELLSPAGDLECLETALHFGAGRRLRRRTKAPAPRGKRRVYDGDARGRRFRRTAPVGSFTSRSIPLRPTRKFRKLPPMRASYTRLAWTPRSWPISACSRRSKKAAPDLPVHVSTQANCGNYAAARVYHTLGASRIVLAREMTLEAIAELRAHVPDELELEAFVHGAMCMAYSGRCLLSAYLTGRSGNRGTCAQPLPLALCARGGDAPGRILPYF